ncbi:alpha/beta fold hydrolase [Agromyces sp. NPDC049794]|uniref:alpha/beta fold hydrolase n=1 Tax=Agromyces sp. NPDC049794 TaxID=3154362 RepID=UPI0033F531D5
MLLIHGAGASMIYWQAEFCHGLAARGRYVIRYDHRDTGESTAFPVGRPGYSLHDLADDALGILDDLGIADAHLVGRSMAGAIVATLAVEHPDRVATVTFAGTTTGDPELPPMTEGFLSAAPTPSAAHDTGAIVEFLVDLGRRYTGTSPYFDEAAARELAIQDVARTPNPLTALTNHFVMEIDGIRRENLRDIVAPALVIHGDLDPVFPLEHGIALADAVPGARLMVLPRVGHAIPFELWPDVMDALVEHTARRNPHAVVPVPAVPAVLRRGDPGYDEARTVWNDMIDHRPLMVMQARSVADVQTAVRLARDSELTVGIRGGGHNVVGYAVPENGLMIDLRELDRVTVDPLRRRAFVQGGALLGTLDRAAQVHGFATTAGNVSHTGVGGLTLGGGMGWLARQFGLTCDNVRSYELVTADGEIIRATAETHPELFWALKGGGGNFGVVTEFEFNLHPVAPQTLIVEADFGFEAADAVLRRWRDLSVDAPRRATFTADLSTDGVTVGFVWIGEPADAAELAHSISRLGRATAQRHEEMTYLALQTRLDVIGGHAKRRYTKNQFIRDLSDDAIAAVLEASRVPGAPAAGMQAYGGAIRDIVDEATAFSHRDTQFDFNTGFAWTDPAEDEARITAAREHAAVVAPYVSGVYGNSSGESDSGVTSRVFDHPTIEKLRRVKAQYDPENLFRHNVNIPPAE